LALRSFGDGALFAESFGEGSPKVLALHGWGRRGADFKASLDGVPALALDLPGFGSSPAPEAVIGADGYAELVSDVLNTFSEPPVVVGHSFGGRVAVCLAVRSPDDVGPLILTGVPLLRRVAPSKPALGYRVVRAFHKAGIISDSRMEAEKRKRGSADYRAATGVMRDILVKVVNEDYPEQLKALRSEVRMLWGAADTEVPVDVANRALKMINESGGKASLETLDDVGHHVPLQAPDALRTMIQAAMR